MLQVGAGRRKCKEASEIHKFSTWQQVLQRGNPFCDKGGLREQRQSESCSKRHHGTREEDFSGRQRVSETLRDCTSISQPNVSTPHSSLSPLFPPKTSQAQQEAPPPCLAGVGVKTQPTWRLISRDFRRWNFTNGKRKTKTGHHFWLNLEQPFC